MEKIINRISPDETASQEFKSQTVLGRWVSPEYKKGLVSIIIPTYNREKLLIETLDSVYAQSYRPISLFVVDDGSTDNTRKATKKWCSKYIEDHNFKLSYFYQKHSGASIARNLGLIESCGEFIQFLDSDDLLHPKKIMFQMRAGLKHPGQVLCGPWNYFYEENGKYKEKSGRTIDLSSNIISQWLSGEFFAGHCFLWPRSAVYLNGPWDETLVREQDGDYFIRAILNNMKFFFVPEAISYYRIPSKNTVSVHKVYSSAAIDSRLRVMSKLRSKLEKRGDFEKYKFDIAEWYYNIAMTYLPVQPEISESCFWDSLYLSKNHDIPQSLFRSWISRFLLPKNRRDFLDKKIQYEAEKLFKTLVLHLKNKSFKIFFPILFKIIIFHPIQLIRISWRKTYNFISRYF